MVPFFHLALTIEFNDCRWPWGHRFRQAPKYPDQGVTNAFRSRHWLASPFSAMICVLRPKREGEPPWTSEILSIQITPPIRNSSSMA